jgi:hypothetical protein
MDQTSEHKIRDLKLKILHAEKELAASQHNSSLGAALRTGHASQMARAAERDRKRLEGKIEELKSQLASLERGEDAPAAPDTKRAAPAKAAAAPKTKKS